MDHLAWLHIRTSDMVGMRRRLIERIASALLQAGTSSGDELRAVTPRAPAYP